jgi:hypothetical protein
VASSVVVVVVVVAVVAAAVTIVIIIIIIPSCYSSLSRNVTLHVTTPYDTVGRL